MLGVLTPTNAILQSQCVDMSTACEVACASLESLGDFCKDECWTELHQAPAADVSQPAKRWRTLSKHLGESVVL